MVSRSRSRSPVKQKNTETRRHGVTSIMDSLNANEGLASLMPTVTRLAAIQKDCAAALPELFRFCSVLRFDSGQLVLTVSNAAIASRLKLELPKLQQYLENTGWQIIAIRSKVQPETRSVWQNRPEKVTMPQQAVVAFAELEESLEKTPQNEALRSAINTLLNRHKRS